MEYTSDDIKFMKSHGFSVNFDWRDEMRGRTKMNFPPSFPVTFVKRDFHVWRIKKGWQTAYINEDGKFVDHHPCLSLEDAVTKEVA